MMASLGLTIASKNGLGTGVGENKRIARMEDAAPLQGAQGSPNSLNISRSKVYGACYRLGAGLEYT